MPNFSKSTALLFYSFLLLFLASCGTSKTALQHNSAKLEIAQNSISQPYIAQPENTSESEKHIQIAEVPNEYQTAENKTNVVAPVKNRRSLKTTAKESIQKIKNYKPDTRPIVQSASKEWKPRKENFSISWKDILFIIILFALLALLGGFLHAAFGVSLVLTMVIAIVIAFVVASIYIWYLHNN